MRELAEFFGPFPERMFGRTHAPEGDPIGAVVICPPTHAELLANYRREVLLARELAQTGFVVQRFHFRGTGHSEGEGAGITYGTMVEDALAAADHITRRLGTDRVMFVGTRWGALVAASASRVRDGAPLVMWEPVVDAARYFREVMRLRIIADMKDSAERETTDRLLARLESEGHLDVLGFSIDRALFEDSKDVTLAAELGDSPRPVLLLQLHPSTRLRPEYASLVDAWREAGFDVQTDVIVDEAAWWFSDQPPRGTNALVDRSTRWLRRISSQGAAV